MIYNFHTLKKAHECVGEDLFVSEVIVYGGLSLRESVCFVHFILWPFEIWLSTVSRFI